MAHEFFFQCKVTNDFFSLILEGIQVQYDKFLNSASQVGSFISFGFYHV